MIFPAGGSSLDGEVGSIEGIPVVRPLDVFLHDHVRALLKEKSFLQERSRLSTGRPER